jgi:hypothetical protein
VRQNEPVTGALVAVAIDWTYSFFTRIFITVKK